MNKIEYILGTCIVAISIGIVLLHERFLFYIKTTDLWYFIIFFFAIITITILYNIYRKNADPYEVINPVLIGYALYAMMLPLNYLVTLHVPTFEIRIPGVAFLPMYQYIIICLIGLAGLLIGYYLPLGKQWGERLPVWKISNRELSIAGFVMLAYGLFSFATNVMAYGSLANFIKVGYGPQRYVIQRAAVHFGSGMEIIGVASLILLYIAIIEKKRIRLLTIVIILATITYITLLIGQRRYIVYLLFMAFIIIHYRFHKIRLRWMVLGAILAYGFFFIYPYTRKMWSEVGFMKGMEETYKVAVAKPELLLPFAGGEFIPPSKIILEVLTDDAFQYQYGATYISGLLRIIPRSGKALPDVLYLLSDWRLKTYYPGLYERGVNFTFFTLAEGYVNFGYLGVFLHMFIFGVITRIIYAYFRKNQNRTVVLVVYAMLFSLMPIESMHAEFSQFIWYITHIYLGPFILVILAVKFLDYVGFRMNAQDKTLVVDELKER